MQGERAQLLAHDVEEGWLESCFCGTAVLPETKQRERVPALRSHHRSDIQA